MLMITIGSGFLLAALALVVNKIITNRLALIRFKKLSRGLPMCPGDKLLGNHTTSLMMGENSCENLRVWHQEMGKTIGWLKGTTFCASTIDLDLIRTFIHDERELHMNRIHFGMPVEEIEQSILLVEEDEWRPLRRVFAPALVPNKFKTPNVRQEIEQSINQLIGLIDRQIAANQSNNENHLFEVDDMAHKFSLDLIFRCFYKQYDLIDFDDPDDTWTRNNEMALEVTKKSLMVKFSLVFPIFSRLVDWLIWNFSTLGSGRRKLVDFVGLQAKQGLEARKQLRKLKAEAKKTGAKIDENNIRLKDGTIYKRNMIDHVIDQFIEGKLTRDQYVNSGVFLLAAGEKTAMDSIVHTIYLLSTNQNVQDRLRKSVMADGIESEYLDWVLKESLRLLPPAPIGCSRTIGRDIKLDSGYVLPSGTFVLTCAYVIHRLKEYWGEDADEFKPERWQDTSHHHPYQYIPFGAGPRSCPGKMFAIHEMKMLFVALLTRYKFEGEPNNQVYKFDSPWWIYLLPSSITKVKISKIT